MQVVQIVLWRKFPESPWGSPIPIGDEDGNVNRFSNGDGYGDGDEAEKRGWGCLAFPIVQNYVKNTWGIFGLQKLMRNDDGVFLFKFATKNRDEITKVPVWIKLRKIPLVAYSEDGLSLIATQIGKPIMLDAFTSSMCCESWGRIGYARALVEINANMQLKKEVIMVVLMEDGEGYTREVISVEYEWKPPHCIECKTFGHDLLQCPKHVKETVSSDPSKVAIKPRNIEDMDTSDKTNDGFKEVRRKKNKGKKADQQPRSSHIDGIRLNKTKPNFYWQKTGTNKSGADLVTKGQMDGPSTSNSFDLLNSVDVGDGCGVSSSMGNQEDDQAVGHDTGTHTSSTWNEEFK
ncbi:putative reverse transcriptase domain, reverse transcriptase zinc-binding domain protein [Tanacetum coccineum]